MSSKREHFERVVKELNLDTSDPFTLLVANGIALMDQRDELKRELAVADTLIDERNRLLDELPCEQHGRCVPHAIEQVRSLREALTKAVEEREVAERNRQRAEERTETAWRKQSAAEQENFRNKERADTAEAALAEIRAKETASHLALRDAPL